jgi:hypothetical protein
VEELRSGHRLKGEAVVPVIGSVTTLETYAAWTLVVTFGLSLAYEVWRATSRADVSRHDSMRLFVTQGTALYVAAAVIIWLLFAGVTASAWIALVFSVALILVSIFYYNPKIMVERQPGLFDWFENLTFTGLLFVAAALLLFEVLGFSLQSG